MKRFTQPLVVLILTMFVFGSATHANPGLSSARIEDGNSDRLTVSFGSPVTLSNAVGFRLVGGSSRIERLISGSGTTKLTFQLTDHVLPDDRFELLYWSEMGDARTGSEKLNSITKATVDNRAKAYRGAGRLYYVSTGGSDSNDGRSASRAFRTVDRAQSVAKAGDYILLKRGDVFKDTFIEAKKSGTAGSYITFAAYGSGRRPVIEHTNKNTFTIADRNFVQVDNLHFKVYGSGETGVYIVGNSQHPVVSNCRIEGFGKPHYGVNYGIKDGGAKAVTSPQILNNYVTGFRWNIRSSGYPYDGTHEVKGGLIENNVCADNRKTDDGDGISAQRGKYHGLVIRKNEIYGYYDDGIDLYGAEDVIAEYNTIHSPQQPSKSGQGIKAGGITRTEKVNGHQSTNIIIRYNTVYNLYNRVNDLGAQNGIQTNSGATGEVYGNLVYDVQGHGIVVSGPIKHWKVHHNTVINAGEDGLQLYTEGSQGGNVDIRNNIVQGKKSDLRCIIRGGGKNAIGQRNILLSKGSSGQYDGRDDIRAKASDLFVNPSQDDYRLKSSAAAIDAGVSVSGYEKTRRGFSVRSTPDVGAFEYKGIASTPSPAPAPAPTPTPKPEPEPTPAPTVELRSAVSLDNPINGIQFEYYEGEWDNLPNFSKIKVAKSGKASVINMNPREQDDYFGLVFTGYFKAPKDGVYTFHTVSDDGSQLFIGDQQVVDNDGIHGEQKRSGKIGLKAGFHPIKITMFQGYGGKALSAGVTVPGGSQHDFKASELFVEKEVAEPAPTPTVELRPAVSLDNPTNGVQFEYYEGKWDKLPDFSKIKALESGKASVVNMDPRQQDDYFGLVFTGYFKAPKDGVYTFHTVSDDGSQLFIGDQRVVDNDGVHSEQKRSGQIGLKAGFHPITVTMFQGYGGKALSAGVIVPGGSQHDFKASELFVEKEVAQPTPAPTPTPGPETKNNLSYRYYEGVWTKLPDFSMLSVQKEGQVQGFDLSVRNREEHFGIVYYGSIQIDKDEEYTFFTNSDDGSQLFIDGKLVVDNDGLHAPREKSGKVKLTAGKHLIIVSFFERTIGEVLEVRYQSASLSKQVIPNDKLSPEGELVLPKPTSAFKSRSLTSDDQKIVSIYPNPSSSIINIDTHVRDEQIVVTIKDMAGRVRRQKAFSTLFSQPTVTIDIASLKSGLYMVYVKGAEAGSQTIRLIRE